MEYLLIIGIAVIVSLLDDRLRGKKKVPPPTVPQEIPQPQKRKTEYGAFEIPPMRGIPSDVQASEEADAEAQRAQEREECVRQEQQPVPTLPYAAAHRAGGLLPKITPDAMKQAIVLAEVLGKPRALRRFPQR